MRFQINLCNLSRNHIIKCVFLVMGFLRGLWVDFRMGFGLRRFFRVGEVGEVDHAEEETNCVENVLRDSGQVLRRGIVMRILMFWLGLNFFLVWNNSLLWMHLFMVFFFLFWFSNRLRLFLRSRRLLLHLFMHFLSKITQNLCLYLLLRGFELDTTLLNPLKMFLDNRVRIEPNNGRFDFSLRVKHSSEGKRISLELITNSRIPSTVEVIYLKLPMFFCLERIDDVLEVSAELTVRGEKLYEFVGGVIIDNVFFVLEIADHSGVREVPFLAGTESDQEQQYRRGEE